MLDFIFISAEQNTKNITTKIDLQANAFHLDNIYGITFLYVIFGLPMNTFLYTGAIKGIPEALDEAAMLVKLQE